MNKYFLYISLIGIAISSCTKVYSPVEYKNWIESDESGLRKEKTVGDITYDLQYETPDYKVLIQNGPKGIMTCDLEAEKAPYNSSHHFVFTIRTSSGENPVKFKLHSQEQFYARQEYLNAGIQKDFFLLQEKKDTLRCLFAHAEREFGIAPHLKIDLAFEKDAAGAEFKFCYNDRMFNNGMIKFSFSSEVLKELPELSQE